MFVYLGGAILAEFDAGIKKTYEPNLNDQRVSWPGSALCGVGIPFNANHISALGYDWYVAA